MVFYRSSLQSGRSLCLSDDDDKVDFVNFVFGLNLLLGSMLGKSIRQLDLCFLCFFEKIARKWAREIKNLDASSGKRPPLNVLILFAQ